MEDNKESEELDITSDEKLMEILLNTREQGQMVEALIKNQIEVKDEMISKLHKELEYYKQDSADRYVTEVMKKIIKIRNDMNKLIRSKGYESLSVDDLKREYVYIFEDITDVLQQQNIDSYQTKPGELFDAVIHKAKIEETQDKSKDKRIARSIEEGYRKGEKVLLPERVIVFKYVKNK